MRAAPEVGSAIAARVVEPDDLLPSAIELAARIAAKSRPAVEAAKQSLRSTWQVDLSTVLATNYWAAAALHPGPDVSEGIDAFLERRPARFNRSGTDEI